MLYLKESCDFMRMKVFCFIFFSQLVFSNQDADSDKKNSLVIGISQEYESLHPHIMTMAAAKYIQYIFNRTLVTMNAKLEWVPVLAATIPSEKNKKVKIIIENNKRKKVAIWEIKAAANWSDGTPITCQDFAYSLEVGKNSLVQVANKEIYDKIERIDFEKEKPKVCSFVYAENSWSFFQMPEFFPLPAHLDKEIFESSKNEKNGYSNKNVYSLDRASKAAYSGPFRITEVKAGSHIVLERNLHFYGKASYFSKIIVKIIPNTNTFEANIRSRTIDMIAAIGITIDQGLDFEKRWSKDSSMQHQVVFKDGANFEHLSFNMDYPIFQDIKVRQALVQSINRDELVKFFFEGKQAVAHFYQPKVCPWFPKNLSKIKTYTYSLRDANRLLNEAGWKKSDDGFRYKDGQKLSFTFITTAGNPLRENIQVYMKNEWKKIGVDVQIKNYPARVLFGEIAKKRQFPGVIMHAWPVAPETVPEGFLASKNIPSEKNNWSGFNFGGWNSPKFDSLIDKIKTTSSNKIRKTIVIEMLNIYNSELPDFPLFYRTDVAVIPKKMKDFQLNGHSYYETNQIENWRY